MNNELKCPKCHAKRNNESICKLCGLDFNKPDDFNSFMTNGFVSFYKESRIFLIILMITIIILLLASAFTEMPESTINVLAMVPTCIMGIILVWVGILELQLGLKMKNLYANGEQVNGEIVDYSQVKDVKWSKDVQVPIIEYKVNDVKYRIVSNLGNKKLNKVGDKVVIKYNSKNPHTALPLGLLAKYKIIMSCSVVTFVMVIVIIVTASL